MAILLPLLAALGLVVLIQQLTRSSRPSALWVSLLPLASAVMAVVAVVLAARGGWAGAIPLAAGAAAAFWRSRQMARQLDPTRPQPLPAQPAMAEAEAYEVLGLAPGADAEAVRAAHRRLIQQMHPDQGGSSYLAAKINQARDLLLSILERRS